MIEILNKSDIVKVSNKEFVDYLQYSFNRLPSDFEYPSFGYFVIIESFDELENNIQLKNHKLPPITNSDFFELYYELYEIRDNILEIVLLLDNDFGISLIMDKNIIPNDIWSNLTKLMLNT